MCEELVLCRCLQASIDMYRERSLTSLHCLWESIVDRVAELAFGLKCMRLPKWQMSPRTLQVLVDMQIVISHREIVGNYDFQITVAVYLVYRN